MGTDKKYQTFLQSLILSQCVEPYLSTRMVKCETETNQSLTVVSKMKGRAEDLDCVDEKRRYIAPCPENMVALDCEMVGIGKGKRNALARCSIVDYHGNVIYDQYVKPSRPITDYRTKWSGILPCHMKRAVPFQEARKKILAIISDKIVIGHSLHFDFKILKYRKHASEVRDTSRSVILRKEASFPLNHTPSLKKLTKGVLDRDIQTWTHCSIEDSVAAMDLYRAVEDKWEKELRDKTSTFLNDSFWPSWIDS